MRERQRTGVMVIVALAGLAAAIAGGVWISKAGRRVAPTVATAGAGPVGLVPGLRRGDSEALATLRRQLSPNEKIRPRPVAELETADLVETLTALRAGFGQYRPAGRAAVLGAA